MLITARVQLGRSKTVNGNVGDRSLTYTQLKSEGYRSVEIVGFHGREFAVYNWAQIEIQSMRPFSG